MPHVQLTLPECEMAIAAGKLRRLRSVARGYKGAAGDFNNRRYFDLDIEGAAAELAYCKFRGVYWGGTLDSFKDADAPGNVQVRWTDKRNGSLIFRPDDNPDHWYVLVTGSMPNYNVIGWIQGHDAMKDEYIRDPNKRPGAYFVPQSDLRQFVITAH